MSGRDCAAECSNLHCQMDNTRYRRGRSKQQVSARFFSRSSRRWLDSDPGGKPRRVALVECLCIGARGPHVRFCRDEACPGITEAWHIELWMRARFGADVRTISVEGMEVASHLICTGVPCVWCAGYRDAGGVSGSRAGDRTGFVRAAGSGACLVPGSRRAQSNTRSARP